MPQRSRSLRESALGALASLAALLVAGCNDDPTCVFTTGCHGGPIGPGALGPAASLPSDGQVILSAVPEILRTEPSGIAVSSTAPGVVVFSESMAPDTIEGKIELVAIDFSGFPIGSIPTTQTLVADGRVLLLLPAAPLTPGDYLIQVADSAELFDLTGQKVEVAAGLDLQTFQVDVDDPVTPELIATFPESGDEIETTSPLVVVFDRPIEGSSITSASFDVQVDGAPPAFDPDPTPLTVETSFLPIIDTRVYLYRSVDGDGDPVSLGTGAEVVLTLSPEGDEIADEDGEFLEETAIVMTTQDIEMPTSAALFSDPTDGIGIANLTLGDDDELVIQVDFAGADTGDEVVITMFGDSFEEEPQLFALARTVELTDAGPIIAASLTLTDLDLAPTPGTARFADGTVAFAFALRRGAQTSPVRLLDVDPDGPGIQDPLLDTVAPTVDELLLPGAGITNLFRTDLRDLVIAGRASEPLRSVEVMTALGDTDTLAPVVGTDENGLFLTQPIPVGQLVDGAPVTFDLIAYDPVLNASAPVNGVFQQKGGVGNTAAAFTPGDPVFVEVVDAVTLEPIVGARVYTHDDGGDGMTYTFRDAVATGAFGDATISSSPAPAAGTILTVEADGYDIFTFHGLDAAYISVPLSPTVPGFATVAGLVTTTSPFAELTLGLLQTKLDDGRRPIEATALFDGDTCASDPFGSIPPSCPFGPEVIHPDRIGALSFVAGNFLLTQGTFSASTLIQAFEFSIPRPPTVGGDLDEAAINLAFLLNEPGLDPTELPIEIAPTVFSTALISGLDTDNLVGDPATTGDPWVSMEALVPGVGGSTAVGLGLAFDQGGGLWDVRAAYPGAVSPTGFFGMTGSVDTDLFLRVELRDIDGNRAGQRPRLSTLSTLPLPFALFAPAVPTVNSPLDGGVTGAATFDVEFDNSILDISGEPGIYRVTVTDGVGRRWTAYLPDPADGALTEVHLPDIASVGGLPGVPLSDGTLTCVVEAFAWPGLDTTAFLMSDIEREYDVFAASAPITFTQP